MIDGLKPYPVMKDSGVPWAGNVPEHWELVPNRAILRKRKVLVGDRYGEYKLLSLTKAGIIVRDVSVTRGKFSADMGTSQEIRVGDLVFCLFDVPETPRTVGLSKYDGMITGAYTVFECRDTLQARFVEAFYIAMDDRKLLSPLYSGLRNTIPPSVFLSVKTPMAPAAEQAAIVRFLDRADRKIRRYIRAKQKLIKLLDEQKQAIIHRAVTRGLDPNVRLKPSGVEWLGDVPEHWEMVRLKYAASHIVDCLHATPAYSEGGRFPAIRTADISPGIVRLDSARRVDEDVYCRWTQRMRPTEGDILYSREGERFGIAACVPKDAALCISQRMMIFRIRPEHNSRFVMWLLNSPSVYAQAIQDVMGSTAPHVNVSTIQNFALCLPSLSEQDTIVHYIETATHGLSRTTDDAHRENNLLCEYRTRLIADVVTGKLDVREAAARLPDEIEESEPLDDSESQADSGEEASDEFDGELADAET